MFPIDILLMVMKSVIFVLHPGPYTNLNTTPGGVCVDSASWRLLPIVIQQQGSNSNHTMTKKKAFQWDAYRLLVNHTCFGGYHQVAALVGSGWVYPLDVPTPGHTHPPPLVQTPC